MGRNFLSAVTAEDVTEATTLEFGAWLPDLMDIVNTGVEEALNVIPHGGGYAPFKDLAPYAGLTLPGACRGAVMVQTLNQDIKLYAATETTLQVRVGGAFEQKMSTVYDKTDYHYWQFVQFDTYLVAVHPEVDPQVVDANTMNNFAELGGDPPRARCAARVQDFLVLGNLDNEKDTVARQPRRVRWNGFNRIDLPWITDEAVQSDYQDMPAEGGDVIAITGREYGTIFQERMISRMTYVGDEKVFNFELVEDERGAIAVGSVVDTGALVYFIAEDGFYVWNGVNSKPIGDNQVNKWFFSQLNYAERARINGAWDAVNQCIVWAFPSVGTALTKEITFSYKEGRWARAEKTVEFLLSSYILPASLDDLHGNLDVDYPLSFDDPSYQGGKLQMAGFDSTHTFGFFTGAALQAVLETNDLFAPKGGRLFVNSARPLVDAATAACTVQAATRDQLIGGALNYGVAASQSPNGECSVLAEGRYIRFKVTIPAGVTWAHAHGLEVWRKAGGRF